MELVHPHERSWLELPRTRGNVGGKDEREELNNWGRYAQAARWSVRLRVAFGMYAGAGMHFNGGRSESCFDWQTLYDRRRVLSSVVLC